MPFRIVGVIILLISISWQLWRIFSTEPIISDRLADWHQRGAEKIINGQKIFYVREIGEGSAGTLLCLHGFPTSSYDWVKMIPDLKKEFQQIVLLDFLGFGFSDKPMDHTYTIFEQADLVVYLADSLQISSAHILAHDYGDTVALELLTRHNNHNLPFEIKSLTMLNGGIFQEIHRPRLAQKLLLIPFIGYLTSQLFNYPMFSYSFSQIFGENQPTNEELQDFWALVTNKNGHEALYKVINFLRERKQFKTRWVEALAKTQTKVLFIYGPADPVNPPEFAPHYRKTIPGQAIVTLSSNVGHYPQWESPTEVTQAFFSFLKPLLIFTRET